MEKGEILINQLFAGSYLDEGTNIGHEVINFFRDDNDDNYLYITPSGKIDENKYSVKSIIFVKNIKSKTTVEVVAAADCLQTASKNEIKYAGRSLNDIFKNNVHRGKNSNEVNCTFKASRVRLPKKRIILTLDNGLSSSTEKDAIKLHSVRKVIVGQSARQYYSSRKDPVAYSELEKLLKNKNYWKTTNTTERLNVVDPAKHSAPTFLEIIRKEKDELTFSNLFAYYFKYNHHCFQKFVQEVLMIKNFSFNFEVVRETNNRIDLWIEGQQHILVIENKIKSGINGTQLDKYQEYTEKRINDPKDSAYKKTSYYFIFAPDYNDLNIEKYCHGKKTYKIIKYSQIYNFFDKYMAEYIDEKYFADFLKGLKNHTMGASELNFNIMKARFLEKISQS